MAYFDPEQYRPSKTQRPFEDSLFAPVEKVQDGGFHQDRQGSGNMAETFGRPQERGIGHPEDICRNKHKGNPESERANERLHSKADLQARIYSVALMRGQEGITLKEIESGMGLLRNTVSARLSELKQKGLLEKNGLVREGCAVLIPRFAEIG